ncbi:MAG: ATPase, T2SS/T4P/T4SS family [Candidatus Micrarchaeia archaeon]|jgi:flagellar protein FlaI
MLGWVIKKEEVDYVLNLPKLSIDEEKVIYEVETLFKEASKYEDIDSKEKAREKIKKIIKLHLTDNHIQADNDQLEYLTETATAHIFGFGFLDKLLQDDNIEEIAIIGLDKPVYVYLRDKGWQKTNGYFTDLDLILDIINKMARQLGRRITYQNPKLSAILPDGSRLHASIPTISNTEITIRKTKENPFTILDLINYKTINEEALALLWVFMQADLSVLISGNTASGKTTSLNALFSFIPLNERVLITEETPEINIPHEHKVNMIANYELGISISSLVSDNLRMRPDRVIVGEVRNTEEVQALIDTILSGQARGSYATFHAQSAHETLRRLHSLGVLDIDLQSIDLIIVQRRMMKYDIKKRESKEIRRIIEISEVDKENPMKTNYLFEYDYEKDILKKKYKNSMLIEKIRKSLGLTEEELEEELRIRTEFLKKIKKQNLNFVDSVKEIQNFVFKK